MLLMFKLISGASGHNQPGCAAGTRTVQYQLAAYMPMSCCAGALPPLCLYAPSCEHPIASAPACTPSHNMAADVLIRHRRLCSMLVRIPAAIVHCWWNQLFETVGSGEVLTPSRPARVTALMRAWQALMMTLANAVHTLSRSACLESCSEVEDSLRECQAALGQAPQCRHQQNVIHHRVCCCGQCRSQTLSSRRSKAYVHEPQAR